MNNIATFTSGIVGFTGGYFWLKSQRSKLNHDALNKLRDDLFKQIEMQNLRLTEVECKLERWKARYWKLYTLHVNLIAKHNLADIPPSFHEEDAEETL